MVFGGRGGDGRKGVVSLTTLTPKLLPGGPVYNQGNELMDKIFLLNIGYKSKLL